MASLTVIARRAAAVVAFVAAWGCDDASGPGSGIDARFPLDSWTLMQDFGVWNESWQGYHLAEDAWADGGDPVYAMADGIVGGIFVAQGYGAVMLIEHRFGDHFVTSLYGHVSRRHGFEVEAGEAVSEGQRVAYIAEDDEDGGAWPPHLHFGIRKGRYDIEGDICGVWFYVGYTRACAEITHEEHRSLWLDPGDFVTGRIELAKEPR